MLSQSMRWSEAPLQHDDVVNNGGSNGINNIPATPQIKNHSVTHHRGYLYCFGGYDGRRNHQTLLIYSLKKQCWITPSAIGNGSMGIDRGSGNGEHFTVRGTPPPGRNGHTATLARSSRRNRQRRDIRNNNHIMANPNDIDGGNYQGGEQHHPPSEAEEVVDAALAELAQAIDQMDAELENNVEDQDSDGDAKINANENAQGGDDDDNIQQDSSFEQQNNPNEDMDDAESNNNNNPQQQQMEDDDDDAQIIIIGGWLGSGPLAASDMWVLDISGGLDRLRWFQPPTIGTPPGPCNMHSADFIPTQNEVYVFRGGNGREYLNDLHALDVESYTWRTVETHGIPPQQRANHSSALLDGTDNDGKSELFIFGGWNGNERLNDIHILDTTTSTWSTPRVMGVLPHPRAGMTLTALRGCLYLFGGSGTSSKCFDDLQVLDRKEMAWLDVNEEDETVTGNRHSSFGGGASYYNNNSSWEVVNRNSGSTANNESGDRTSSSSWDMLGGQDGTGGGSFGDDHIKFAAWRSYAGTTGGQPPLCNSANPNDEDMVPSVYVTGKPPGRRAGQTSTAVGRHIFIFGGSCGTDYLNDFFVLDTDPPPMMRVTEPPSPQLYASRLRHFCNDEEFSDVTFLVEGRKVYGHKLVLSTVSDCFRAMFMTGFRESGSDKTEIEIPNTTYSSFVCMMEYIYTGKGPTSIDVFSSESIDQAISLLELADQFFLYNLKQIIEGMLQPAVNGETYTFLSQVAQKTNANQLESYCRYFERNMNELRE